MYMYTYLYGDCHRGRATAERQRLERDTYVIIHRGVRLVSRYSRCTIPPLEITAPFSFRIRAAFQPALEIFTYQSKFRLMESRRSNEF